MAAWFGTLFVDRDAPAGMVRVSRLLAGRLADGGSLAVFLEGTSTDGSSVEPFKAPLLKVPAATAMSRTFPSRTPTTSPSWAGRTASWFRSIPLT